MISFLGLPQEIQDMIYRFYYQGIELTVKHEVATFARLKFNNLPTLAIESVCRRTSRDARAIREQIFTRTLTIEPSSRKCVLEVTNNPRYT